MTPFDFIFALLSIVTSLALTHLISGVIALVRQADRRSFSWTHALWVWLAFVLVIGNWAALFAAQNRPDWPAGRILLWLGAMISLYAFCALVMPRMDGDRAVDLADFERRESRRYIVAHNVFAACALLLIFTGLGFTPIAIRLAVSPLLAIGLGMLALFIRGPSFALVIAGALAANATLMTLALLASLSG